MTSLLESCTVALPAAGGGGDLLGGGAMTNLELAQYAAKAASRKLSALASLENGDDDVNPEYPNTRWDVNRLRDAVEDILTAVDYLMKALPPVQVEATVEEPEGYAVG